MSIALISLWIALSAVLLTTAIAAALRAFGAVSGSRRERYRVGIAEQLAAYAVGASDDPPPSPTGRLEQRVMHDELARMAPNLKGESRELLAELFASYGLIRSVVRDLRSEHPLTAIRAAELAGIMHASECIPILCERMSAEPLVRLACARALGELGAEDAMPLIVDALAEDGNAAELGEILMSFGPRAEPFLSDRLVNAPRGQERRIAAVALGEIHARSAVPELVVELLEDAEPEVRAGAARALGKIGERSARGALVLALEHPDPPFTGVAAATALGMLDDPASAPALVRALSSENWDVRNAAARSLVAFGERGVAGVVECLGDVSADGVAHFAGLLDVADRLDAVIARAAAGDDAMDRFTHAACTSGVRSRLEELACADAGPVAGYAARVLASVGAPA